jgi:hypothetical protein
MDILFVILICAGAAILMNIKEARENKKVDSKIIKCDLHKWDTNAVGMLACNNCGKIAGT